MDPNLSWLGVRLTAIKVPTLRGAPARVDGRLLESYGSPIGPETLFSRTAIAIALLIASMTDTRAATDECRRTAEAIAVATEAPIGAASDSGFSFLIRPPFYMSLTCPSPDASGDFPPALNIRFEGYPASSDFFEVVGTAGAAVIKLSAMLINQESAILFFEGVERPIGSGRGEYDGVTHVDRHRKADVLQADHGCITDLAAAEGRQPVAEVITGVIFKDGVEVTKTANQCAA
jgi:hypothetical protein